MGYWVEPVKYSRHLSQACPEHGFFLVDIVRQQKPLNRFEPTAKVLQSKNYMI